MRGGTRTRSRKRTGSKSGRRRTSRRRSRSAAGANALSGPSILNFLAANDPSLQTFSESATLAALLSSSAALTGPTVGTQQMLFGQPSWPSAGLALWPTPPSKEAQARLKQQYPQLFYDEDTVPLNMPPLEQGNLPLGSQTYPPAGLGVSTQQNWGTRLLPSAPSLDVMSTQSTLVGPYGGGGTQILPAPQGTVVPLATADISTGAALQPGWIPEYDTRANLRHLVVDWRNVNTDETTQRKPVILPEPWERHIGELKNADGTVELAPYYYDPVTDKNDWIPPGWEEVSNEDNSGVDYQNRATGEEVSLIPNAIPLADLPAVKPERAWYDPRRVLGR